MTHQEVEKYRRPIRILHWINSGAFVIRFLTGLVLFIPALGFLVEDSWTRLIHRIAAAIFIIVPVIYLIINPAAVGRGLKQAFTWGAEDIYWLKAAPRYYFLGDEKAMTSGKISVDYAKMHHGKWYEEAAKGQEEKTQ
jgi:cytochrome b subunit of formate dehydrogenase